jgi:hypothetical protein
LLPLFALLPLLLFAYGISSRSTLGEYQIGAENRRRKIEKHPFCTINHTERISRRTRGASGDERFFRKREKEERKVCLMENGSGIQIEKLAIN